MKAALIIVHAEKPYTDPEDRGKDSAFTAREVFDNISKEIPRFLEQNYPVYFFGQEARSADSELVYEGIRAFAADIIFFGPDSKAAREYLRAKERLMADSIDEIVLGGVSRLQCVAEVFDLLSGLNVSLQRVDPDAYKKASEELGWDERKFEYIYDARLTVRITEEFTAH